MRPEYQAPNAAASAVPAELGLTPGVAAAVAAAEPVKWPAQAVEQIGALKRFASLGSVFADETTRHFQGARPEIVERHLETLAILGELRALDDGRYSAASSG